MISRLERVCGQSHLLEPHAFLASRQKTLNKIKDNLRETHPIYPSLSRVSLYLICAFPFSVILFQQIIYFSCLQNICRDCSHDIKSIQRIIIDFLGSLLFISMTICQCISQHPEMTHHVFTRVTALEGRVRNWKFLATGKTNVIPA